MEGWGKRDEHTVHGGMEAGARLSHVIYLGLNTSRVAKIEARLKLIPGVYISC